MTFQWANIPIRPKIQVGTAIFISKNQSHAQNPPNKALFY
jgi:hypothetical protein